MCMFCNIVPESALRRLAEEVGGEQRDNLIASADIDRNLRQLRDQSQKLTIAAFAYGGMPQVSAGPPAISVYTAGNNFVLPGNVVNNPGSSPDSQVKTTFAMTGGVADFYKSVFGRNSLDNAGMALLSTVHYGTDYNNAFWNGTQMAYGDGDGQIFTPFCNDDDVVAHELTHGVTQFTLQLVYKNESGGLNESLSDVFGSMFRQWRRKQSVKQADWLVGADIMGPDAKNRGYTCLRDMANPSAKHCLAPQITNYGQYKPGMDPHTSSGIGNLAFHTAAIALGGNSWDKAGQVWYDVVNTAGPRPNMTMKQFAKLLRASAKKLFPADPGVYKAVDDGWKSVGI